MKRGGGRRYYRPEDVDVLKGIRILLYDDGFTIKGVQKVFRERGVRYVAETGRRNTGDKIGDAAHPVENAAKGAGKSKSSEVLPPNPTPVDGEIAPRPIEESQGKAVVSETATSDALHMRSADEVTGLTVHQRQSLEHILRELTSLKDRLDKYRSKRNSQRVVSQINLAKRKDLSNTQATAPKEARESKG